jgi:hypothetical protein
MNLPSATAQRSEKGADGFEEVTVVVHEQNMMLNLIIHLLRLTKHRTVCR